MIAAALDAALEATVVGSFTRVGASVRRRLDHWDPPPAGALSGRTVVITGATSGIGRVAAAAFVAGGANVHFLARDESRARQTRDHVAAAGPGAVTFGVADVADFASLRTFARDWLATGTGIDVLVHNAGALNRRYSTAPDGTEATLAAHLLGPFLLTRLLQPVLGTGPSPSRVLTMSSGGMYTQRFSLEDLEVGADGYDGRVAYARAKRAQVVLNREWSRRVDPATAVFHALHPGWVDTPGVVEGLPGFHKVMGPLLRPAADGADTLVWLATAEDPLRSTGDFWHDRRRRSEHRVPWTRTTGDDGADGQALWAFCAERTGGAGD